MAKARRPAPGAGDNAPPPDWAALRREFPALERWTYFELANKAPLPRCVDAAIADYLRDTREEAGINAHSQAKVAEAREAVARLVDAPASCIAFLKNTSEGINTVARGLRLQPGDNVLIPEDEYWSSVFGFRLLEADGVEVRWVRPVDGVHFPVEAFIARMDAKTRAVAASWVSYVSGARIDVPALTRACRERGIVSVIDAIQAVGVLDLSFAGSGADVIAGGSHKGLLSMPGVGILYLRPEVQARIRPSHGGQHGFVAGQGKEAPLRPWEDARRYEGGNFNYLGLWALARTAGFLRGIGLRHVEARVRALAERLVERAEARGLRVITPRAWEERAGITTIAVAGDPDQVVKRLREKRILANVRGAGAIRVSPHFFNTEEEVDRLVAAL
ncbi:MAG: aminotransferase class V-fold PLP-dependent enzyme [Proteobacteria bacterium]|nr:aminotransferase class V-fold PLP-dependent enzyme [Pseudomonadota bacterium]